VGWSPRSSSSSSSPHRSSDCSYSSMLLALLLNVGTQRQIVSLHITSHSTWTLQLDTEYQRPWPNLFSSQRRTALNTLSQPVKAATVRTTPTYTTLTLRKGLFINNEFVPATSGEKIETINPYDESVIATVEAAGEKDVDAAVAAARAAFKTGSEWRNLTPQERGVLLWKLADLCKRDEHILATIDAWDNGRVDLAVCCERGAMVC